MRGKERLPMLVKDIGDDGTFTGTLAVYNNVDLGGDKILPGAFTKTMQEKGNEIPMLWQHKPDSPIGMLSLEDSPGGLRVKGKLLLEDETAMKAYRLLKSRIIKGLSIGYDTVKDSVENGVRALKEVRLWEGSVVTFPMNPLAAIDSVKALEAKGDFTTELSIVQLQDAQYQMFNALWSALTSLTWDTTMTRDEKVAMGQSICEDFATAYMDYLPKYLDWLNAEYGMDTMSRKRMQTKAAAQTLVIGSTKEGREFSSGNLKQLKEAHEHVKATDQIFNALFSDEAATEDDDPDEEDEDGEKAAGGTSERKAAGENHEPDEELIHSADAIKELEALLLAKK